jgi:hypothetical protein
MSEKKTKRRRTEPGRAPEATTKRAGSAVHAGAHWTQTDFMTADDAARATVNRKINR